MAGRKELAMLIPGLKKQYKKNLDALQLEIELYQAEKNIWATPGDINNSSGNLAMHIVGNLNHFIGSILGKTGYERDRDAEFSSQNVDRKTIIEEIMETKIMLDKVLSGLHEEDMTKRYPYEIGKDAFTNGQLLIYLLTHLTYHLGQVNYHRRMTDV